MRLEVLSMGSVVLHWPGTGGCHVTHVDIVTEYDV